MDCVVTPLKTLMGFSVHLNVQLKFYNLPFRKLDPTKVQMDFALMNDVPSPYYDEIIERGSKIFILPSINNVYHHYQECKKILRDGDYDVVCDNNLIKSIPMMHAAKKCGVPVRILHSHNTKLSTSIKN